MKKTKAPKSPPTDAQLRQIAVDRYRDFDHDYDTVIPPVPANRKLVVGDEVVVGNLKDCRVAELFAEDRIVVIDHHDLKEVHGQIVDNGRVYGCWPWVDVFKKSDAKDTSFALRRINNHYISSSVDSLLHRAFKNGIDGNAEYQRGYAWSLEDKQRFIESIFRGRDLGKFIFISYPWPKNDYVVLDGKQRMNALMEFVTSQFTYRGLYWHEMSIRDRYQFEDCSVQYANLDGERYSKIDLLEMFLDINAAGVPQTEDHLIKIRKMLTKEKKERMK